MIAFVLLMQVPALTFAAYYGIRAVFRFVRAWRLTGLVRDGWVPDEPVPYVPVELVDAELRDEAIAARVNAWRVACGMSPL